MPRINPIYSTVTLRTPLRGVSLLVPVHPSEHALWKRNLENKLPQMVEEVMTTA